MQLSKPLFRPTTACACPAPFPLLRLWHSLPLPASSPPHTCSYLPQQMQMSLRCVIKELLPVVRFPRSPRLSVAATATNFNFFFRGEFLINLVASLLLLASKTDPAPAVAVPQRVTRTYRLFIDNEGRRSYIFAKMFWACASWTTYARGIHKNAVQDQGFLPYHGMGTMHPGSDHFFSQRVSYHFELFLILFWEFATIRRSNRFDDAVITDVTGYEIECEQHWGAGETNILGKLLILIFLYISLLYFSVLTQSTGLRVNANLNRKFQHRTCIIS